MKIVATYDYRDEAGQLLYQIVRTEAKEFFARRPIPGTPKAWAYGLQQGHYAPSPSDAMRYQLVQNKEPSPLPDGTIQLLDTRRVLYRLPELMKAGPNQPVLITEGEKDADLLASLGLVATCNSGGVGKWEFGFGSFLTGRRVFVLPDNDMPGEKHAWQVVASALAHGASEVAYVQWVGVMPAGGDVTDFLAPWTKIADPSERRRACRQAIADLASEQKIFITKPRKEI